MRTLLVIYFLLFALLISGCSVVIDTGGDPGVWQGTPRDDATTIAEIDAAASLSFDSGKEKAFKNIASRPRLSAKAQSYLVSRAMRSLSFDNGKEAVMLALINNPDFLAEGKQAILENLNQLSFDNGKEKILAALNRRGYVPSENEVEIILRQQPEEAVSQ